MPRKAAWLRFEKDPRREFLFYLAAQLGMTVERLLKETANSELVEWSVYYGREAQRRQLAQRRR